ncbi:MAG: DUF882 domain-containing protein [Aestuariivirga sp.]|uniref:DUF882 domain-containing protein n=1 Tax=Aestuariivirga sp. TaxID=2650926 RepID=UPI0038D216FE
MGLHVRKAGHLNLIQRWKKAATAAAVALAFGLSVVIGSPAAVQAGGETRTLSLYQVHTKERLTVTYMKNGKYVPSAMKKLNYFLRDWRRNEAIAISPKTNAFLKKIGRNVARKSQHMIGNAIDLYFPDVPTVKIRNSALVREIGGVGYYRSGGGPTGFVHIDSGRVRHWGPAISQAQMAKIMRDYRKTVGARVNKKGMKAVPETEIAEADATATSLPSQQAEEAGTEAAGKKKKIPLETAYTEDDEELAGMSADASAAPATPKLKPAVEGEATAEAATGATAEATADGEGISKGYPAPKPRPKPIEVLMMAAVNMKIEPASAPPPDQSARHSSQPLDGSSIGVVIAAETMTETGDMDGNGKTSLAEDLMDGEAEGVPTIRTITASAAGDDLFWWPQQLIFDNAKAVRRDGAPQQFAENGLSDPLPGVSDAPVAAQPRMPRLAVANTAAFPTDGGADLASSGGPGKGDLPVSLMTIGRTAQQQN